MKLSAEWLQEWIPSGHTISQLADQLTMAGVEVEGLQESDAGTIIDVSIPPNRGDCSSVLGLARELAVLTGDPFKKEEKVSVAATITDKLTIHVQEPLACPRYLGRVIKGIRTATVTPEKIQKRLAQSEINLIHPVVDILNYVMLELGQPMHAFDAKKLTGNVTVRLAKAGESFVALGGQAIMLVDSALVIADEKGVQAIAGIIGGEESGVSSQTTDLFLESALFTLERIAGKARLMGLHTDSSFRFERGVDPILPSIAMERATQLILEYCGGKAGPIVECLAEQKLPVRKTIVFRPWRFKWLIGSEVPESNLQSILEKLQCRVGVKKEGWEVTPPSYRYDLNEEVDLIEELARIIGYSELESNVGLSKSMFNELPQAVVPLSRIKRMLVDWGYQEVITYSFVEEKAQRALFPDQEALSLVNPISSEMKVMRLSMWTGLLTTLRYNQYRQQGRLKLFEIGQCFRDGAKIWEEFLGGIVCGDVHAEHWGVPKRKVDFYDIKGQIESLFKVMGQSIEKLSFRPTKKVAACHPGQCAEIFWEDEVIGIVGRLHPGVQKEWDVQGDIYLFEIKAAKLKQGMLSRFSRPSRFPEIRRDISFIVDEGISSEKLVEKITNEAGDLLQEVIVFDVYMGKGIEIGRKSVAMGLILQHPSRTLVDREVDDLMRRVVVGLEREFNAKLRD